MFEEYADPEKRHVESLQSPVQITRIGPGAIFETGKQARQQGMRHALLVTDGHFLNSEAAHIIQDALRQEGVEMTAIASATPTPLQSDVERAVARLQEAGCDGVISLGGGSVQDVGKCTALLGRSQGTLHRFAHGQDAFNGTLPHMSVPTTAGTGAERSAYAFITEEKGREHMVIHDAQMIPEVAVIDPIIHCGMPPRLTASTGLNALGAAIEAYLSPQHSDASDEDALEAIGLVAHNLAQAFEDGQDLEARTNMARAAYLAGCAFEAAGLGVADSISLVISSIFNVGHSTANAIVLPHVMAYELFAVPERLDRIAKAMGADVDAEHEVHPAIAAVNGLKARLDMEETLQDRGLSWDDLYLVARSIIQHPFSKRSPRELDTDGLTEILLDAMEAQQIPVQGRARLAAA